VESRQDKNRKPPPSKWPNLYRYASMGLELAAAIVGLTLAGWWVDYRFGTGRKGILVGAILGIVGGFYNFLKQALELSRQQNLTKGDDSDNGNDPNKPD